MPLPQYPAPALIVVDMVVDFFDAAIWPESELPAMRARLVDGLQAALEAFRAAGAPVIWIRQEFAPDLSDAFPHMRRTGKRYTLRGTPGAEIVPELPVLPGEPVLIKRRFSAFYETALDRVLHERRVGTTVLAGITTSWCIRSTAVDAYQRGYAVLLLRECLGGFSTEDHARDLAAMDGYIAQAIGTADLGPLF